MATFPVLTQGPDVETFKKSPAFDPTIRTQFENGYRQTRNVATTVPDVFELMFSHLTAADKAALETFESDSVGYGGASFSWANTDPNDGTTHEVCFAQPIEFQVNPIDPLSPQVRYRAKIVLEEAI